MRSLMVAGTSSWAGKSPITTGLCASLRRRGVRVAPFEAQNMSDNARVVYGGEIGTAQYLQALAAGVAPPVDHNPVLVKPESDTSGQVVVDGVVDRELSRTPWRERAPVLWGSMGAAFDRGGAFAHLYGTWALLGQDDRRRIRGFVLNKFRGDPALLDPGPSSWRR